MTKDTDHPLKICLPDGIHTYYGYDEKLPYAYLFPRMFLAFKTVAGIRYLPLSPVKKVEYALTTSRMIMTIDGENSNVSEVKFYPVEGELTFTVTVKYVKMSFDGTMYDVTVTADTKEYIEYGLFDDETPVGNLSKIYNGETKRIISYSSILGQTVKIRYKGAASYQFGSLATSGTKQITFYKYA